jgi:D-alanyl-D-alanine carboxypeptidase
MKLNRRAVLGAAGAVLAAPMVRAQSHADGLAEAFIAAHGLPGVTWAVQRASGQVYTGAAGYADLEAGEWMTPDHRMRVASCSKPITSAMIHQLEAEGSLSVRHRPLAADGVLSHLVPEDLAYQPLLDEITIDHLLTHTAGGWTNDAQDPTFTFMDLDSPDLIRQVLQTRAPDALPGTAWAYSNLGYLMLGRIIEEVVGHDCVASVWAWLADPAGAASFDRAGDTLADRKDGEVVYISGNGGDPYGVRASRRDSSGGYIMTAADLLAIYSGFDGLGFETTTAGVADRMATPWEPGGSYGRGLMLNPDHGNRWHNGSLPGTTSFAVMIEGGDLVCALSNGRTDTSGTGIAEFIWDIYGAV